MDMELSLDTAGAGRIEEVERLGGLGGVTAKGPPQNRACAPRASLRHERKAGPDPALLAGAARTDAEVRTPSGAR